MRPGRRAPGTSLTRPPGCKALRHCDVHVICRRLPGGEKHYFDPNAWQADLRRIIRIYQSEGYYNARITDEQVILKPAAPPYPDEGVFESTKERERENPLHPHLFSSASFERPAGIGTG